MAQSLAHPANCILQVINHWWWVWSGNKAKYTGWWVWSGNKAKYTELVWNLQFLVDC